MKQRKNKPAPNRMLPLLLIIGGAVLVVAVVIYIAINSPTTTAPQATSSSITIPFPDVTRATLDEAKQAFDSQSAIIVDVRDTGSYAAEHISGAINIPLAEIETRINELPKDSWIITYCT